MQWQIFCGNRNFSLILVLVITELKVYQAAINVNEKFL